jgi:peptidoglycan/xylan/chitin deacetylase (PgdA/CDA1 family)
MNKKISIFILGLLLLMTIATSISLASAATKGCVSLTFDDGTASQASIIYPLMKARGIVGTFYIPTGNVKVNQIPIATLQDMQANGNEIGSHSVSHSNFVSLSDAQIAYECSQSKATLESWGLTVNNFAYPYGTGDLTHADTIVSQYFDSARTTRWNTNNMPNAQFELNSVYGQSIGADYVDLLGNLKTMVNRASQNNAWTIFYFHDVTTSKVNAIANGGIFIDDFIAFLNYLKSANIQILTVEAALNIGTYSPTPTPSPTPVPGSQIAAVTATVSSFNGASYGPLNAIDGLESNSNYWGTAAANGLPQWLKVDIGSPTSINQVVTHFYNGDTRTYTYYIEASADGSFWTPVVPSKLGSGVVTDSFSQVYARYIRITVTGNTVNTAAHIEEIKVFSPT